jgi:hypothetical protein
MYMLINYVVFVALFSIFFLYFVDYSTIIPHFFGWLEKVRKKKNQKFECYF